MRNWIETRWKMPSKKANVLIYRAIWDDNYDKRKKACRELLLLNIP